MSETPSRYRTKRAKRKVINRSRSKQGTPYSAPTTIDQCIARFHEQRRSSDQWLVAICQHIAIQRMSRMDVADLLMQSKFLRHVGFTKETAWTCAGRLYRLSRDENALLEIKYGLQDYAKRMTITKLPF